MFGYDIKTDPVYMALQALTDDQAVYLSEALDNMSWGYAEKIRIANEKNVSTVQPSRKLPSFFYHTELHALEMYNDAKYIKRLTRQLLPSEVSDKKIELLSKLIQCMHAVHDIVQDAGFGANEVQSYEIFKTDLIKLMRMIGMDEKNTCVQNLCDMASQVIVDGTLMVFTEKATEGELKFMSPTAKNPKSLLATLAMLKTSANDTARMVNLPAMLKDEDDRKALNKQYQSLKDNPIIKMLFDVLQTPQASVRSNIDKNLRMYQNQVNSDKDFDGLQDSNVIPILSFMQLMGQNLRFMREVRKNDVKFVTPYSDAIMLRQSTKGLTDDVEAAYEYIMKNMETEVAEKGFSGGMATKKCTLASINEKFKKLFGLNIFESGNQNVWADYVQNSKKVLEKIRTQEQKFAGNPQGASNFKKEIVDAFALIGRNQTGIFINPIPHSDVRKRFTLTTINSPTTKRSF